MTERGILGFGAYLPLRRLQRPAIHAANKWFVPGLGGLAKGEKAIANWDEDTITMAVEAARNCLGDRDRPMVGNVSLASTTLPFADRLNSGIVKEALNLPDETSAQDMTGSLRAGTSLLFQALQGEGSQLCLAAEHPKARPGSEAEMQQGDGAAALLIGEGAPVATLIGSHSVTIDFVDHFRSTGEDFNYVWESRWVRDEGYTKILGGALVSAFGKSGIDPAAIDHALIAAPVRGVPDGLARKAGIRPEAVADTLVSHMGDTGTAHPLMMLVAALEKAKPGEKILLAGFGQGADVLIFEATDAITNRAGSGVAAALASGQADENYSRFLFHRGLLNLEKGMRAEMDEKQPGTALMRNRKAVLGLVGGRCTRTGTIQFPPSEISVAQNDRAQGTQEDYPLAEKRATILTYTADRLTFSPDPPGYYGMVDFEGGGRMMTEFTDVLPEDVEVGREMRMSFRIKAQDEMRGFTKYFWKATPLRKGA